MNADNRACNVERFDEGLYQRIRINMMAIASKTPPNSANTNQSESTPRPQSTIFLGVSLSDIYNNGLNVPESTGCDNR
ncbi:hypothetical protein [Halorubrum lipolyticum]|uniref:hypothetical protein n=1 Tax=Halorubrum lipolyticum TaxID=368624 RepID=UPI00146160FB|nr:hypothetical protein [Halorubrum lipolyticum]